MSATNNLRFECPHCQKRLFVPAQAAGKRVRCPKCSKPVSVPQQSAIKDRPAPTAGPVLWPWFVGGGVALLLLVGLGIGLVVGIMSRSHSAPRVEVAIG